jgi:hypothetical protein
VEATTTAHSLSFYQNRDSFGFVDESFHFAPQNSKQQQKDVVGYPNRALVASSSQIKSSSATRIILSYFVYFSGRFVSAGSACSLLLLPRIGPSDPKGFSEFAILITRSGVKCRPGLNSSPLFGWGGWRRWMDFTAVLLDQLFSIDRDSAHHDELQ